MVAAAGLAAPNASRAGRDRRCNDFARMPANARWSASGNANGAGYGGMAGDTVLVEDGRVRGSPESQEMSLPY
jgi:hypothetical protein